MPLQISGLISQLQLSLSEHVDQPVRFRDADGQELQIDLMRFASESGGEDKALWIELKPL